MKPLKKPEINPARRAISPKGGGKLVPGNPGNRGGAKGRSGRKPDIYRDLCRELVESPAAQKSVRKILGDARHPHFATIYKHLAEYAHGKPEQPIGGGREPITIRVVYDEVPVPDGAD